MLLLAIIERATRFYLPGLREACHARSSTAARRARVRRVRRRFKTPAVEAPIIAGRKVDGLMPIMPTRRRR